MVMYSPEDVLHVARTKLCKEFPDKDLHPVGSGNGKLWITLHDDAQLNMYLNYADGSTHYELVCPSTPYKLMSKMFNALITPKVFTVFLPGKAPIPSTPHSLDVIVMPRLCNKYNETCFEMEVNSMVSHGQKILELYFEHCKNADSKSRHKKVV